ncbi:MAG: hypothetical protein F2814_05835, partial [Actinobacteria bacterium]|nr:hypothetical protein [Actinomycetota bacterium]
KICADLKSGKARVVALKIKCQKTEITVTIPMAVEAKEGAAGKSILHGTTLPVANTTGTDGDFYIDTLGLKIYGPRTGGVWGTGTSIVGPAGPSGRSVISGTTIPVDRVTGEDGFFYIDTVAKKLYGPRTSGLWGVGVSLIGPAGLNGSNGAAGATGTAGTAGAIGPKGETGTAGAAGADGAIGPKGETGTAGAAGADGAIGPKGETGTAGAAGADGAIGPKGETGTAGGYGDYGSFYDTTLTRLVAQNVSTSVQLNTTAFSQGISITSSSHITFANVGRYNVAFSLQLVKVDPGTDVLSIWFSKDGTPVPWTNTDLVLVGGDQRAVAAWNFFVDITAAGQYVEICLSPGTSTNTSLVSTATQGASPVRPEIPDAIVTVNQIG